MKKKASKEPKNKKATKSAKSDKKAVKAGSEKATKGSVMCDQEKIRSRAYQIWLKAGKPEGSAEQHWVQAEGELSSPSAKL